MKEDNKIERITTEVRLKILSLKFYFEIRYHFLAGVILTFIKLERKDFKL